VTDAERQRLADPLWSRWGPYVAERAWGTVREDYSADGDAWRHLTYEDARSTAYRWSEDGIAGICDDEQRLVLAWAFWNGTDATLKERMFGLTNAEGNHGEDVKEEWWYLDATPTSSYLSWAYRYPQRSFPYDELRRANVGRSRDEREFELADTDALQGCWDLTLQVGKDGPESLLLELTATNTGDAPATLHVLPTLWFRNTWSWDPARPVPVLSLAADGAVLAAHPALGEMVLRGPGQPLFCDNVTNTALRYGVAGSPYPKDGIGDHVVHGAATVNPAARGTKAALHSVLTIGPGASQTVTVRLSRPQDPAPAADLLDRRHREADAFAASLLPVGTGAAQANAARQALAGMLWGKCFYHYDVERWLLGDPGQPPPPPSRLTGRNASWQHVDAHDVLPMPDPWEYPWFAAWDHAFHCVVLAHVDPVLAKEQLLLLCREWYMHPAGQLPAYEWDFGDANPPVHAWAALEVFRISGGDDVAFLARVFHKLLLNVAWWFNREDPDGNDLFAGGFLGLDNIGPFDRSHVPPDGGRLEQADGTAWMAMYCLDLLEMALVLARTDRSYEDVAVTFFEHFTRIAKALETQGLWDEQDGFCYDLLHRRDGADVPLRVRSVAGLIVLAAVQVVDAETLRALPVFADRLHRFLEQRPEYAAAVGPCGGDEHGHVLSVLDRDRIARLWQTVFDEAEFLSPHGIRSLSKKHAAEPYVVDLGAGPLPPVRYEPAESSTGLFGGNSNWRGPVWFPVNHLLLGALRRTADAHPDLTVELPAGSGRTLPLAAAAAELRDRLVSLLVPGSDGRVPAAGDRQWPAGRLWFSEYFSGDTGEGLGASHQTGWTGLVADLVLRPDGGVPER
jgi:hypothetical protein